MKITCLIVDDEHAAREGLFALCAEYSEIEVVGVCKNGIEAIDEIQALSPNLVLLDIQMPGINGFEVLMSIPSPRPQIIFITAHDQFAIKAFEVNAIDYLLKPFSDERFDQAMQRAISRITYNHHQNLETLIKAQENHAKIGAPDMRDSDDRRLVIKADGCIHMIQKTDISHIEAFDYYVKIYVHQKFFLIRETMKNLEDRLDLKQFMRVHKSYIVSRSFVQSLVKPSGGDYELVLTTGQSLKISRSKVTEVKEWLN